MKGTAPDILNATREGIRAAAFMLADSGMTCQVDRIVLISRFAS